MTLLEKEDVGVVGGSEVVASLNVKLTLKQHLPVEVIIEGE